MIKLRKRLRLPKCLNEAIGTFPRKDNTMVSIKDVAKECGVSVSTVSKALNGHMDVSEAKKELIRNKAKEMGYSPNSYAKALKTNRSYSIGVLCIDEARNGLTHDFFSKVLNSFKVTVESYGYDITFIANNMNNPYARTYLERCRYRGFDGVIIACVDFEEEQVRELMQSDIPIVVIDYTYNRTISVLSNNLQGMKELTQYAIDMGHTDIAYLYGEDSLVTSNRLSAFYITMEENGIAVNDAYVQEAKYRDMELAAQMTRGLLAMEKPPTCILYPDDYSCYGGINAIRSMGLRIPEDISVAGYDGSDLSRQLDPEVTTVAQDTERMGSIAAEKLVSLIERPRTTLIEQIMVDATFCKGGTIGKPVKKS